MYHQTVAKNSCRVPKSLHCFWSAQILQAVVIIVLAVCVADAELGEFWVRVSFFVGIKPSLLSQVIDVQVIISMAFFNLSNVEACPSEHHQVVSVEIKGMAESL
jgi:hypothetical protein